MNLIFHRSRGKRPLAISCIEDKLVQQSVNEILQEIYEPVFLESFYGYRAGRNCHKSLKALNQATYRHPKGAIVEIDLRQYFNTIPQKEIRLILEKKISDKGFLRLIDVLMIAPIQEGKRIYSDE
jgi:RNA-directed DNA polymerase